MVSKVATILLLVFAFSAGAHEGVKEKKDTTSYFQPSGFHILPDSTGIEYQGHLKTHALQINIFNQSNKQLEAVVTAGERNLDWLKLINSKRADDKKISFTSPSTRRGNPIDSPNRYSPSIVRNDFDTYVYSAPDVFIKVVLGLEEMSAQLPLDEAEYIRLGHALDRLYQSATRWLLLEPYLSQMAANSAWDIRGYYFLNKMNDLKNKLDQLKSLDPAERAEITTWLVGVCRNSDRNVKQCTDELAVASRSTGTGAYKFYEKYLKSAKVRFESFFRVPNSAKRSDVTWTKSNSLVASIPFLEPEPLIKEFMLNVEDEWRWGNWQLKLDFRKSGFGIPRVIFRPGVTPNVDRLGGNVITMDANAPLTEWEPSWTIRHEFGHVLGFPDCYVEFYDTSAAEMINYQIDITDLMCSRAGNLKEIHFEEMQRVYLK